MPLKVYNTSGLEGRRLVFMGTAQDAGVPQVGCKCENCAKYHRFPASLAVLNGEKAVIIDVTPDFRWQYHILTDRYKVQISAIYLTHAHWGHYGGLPLFGKEGWNTRALPLFMSQGLFDYLKLNAPFSALFRDENFEPRNLVPNSETEHGITAFKVPHRSEYSDTNALVINVNGRYVLYMPDIDALNPTIIDTIRKCDLAIIDGTFYDRAELNTRDLSQVPHPLLSDTMRTFADIADRIVFTHLNHTNPLLNPDHSEMKRLIERGFRVADDWDVIE